MRIMGWIVGWKFRLSAAKSFEMWWPGTELNRRRQPFQGCALPPELPGHAFALWSETPCDAHMLERRLPQPGQSGH